MVSIWFYDHTSFMLKLTFYWHLLASRYHILNLKKKTFLYNDIIKTLFIYKEIDAYCNTALTVLEKISETIVDNQKKIKITQDGYQISGSYGNTRFFFAFLHIHSLSETVIPDGDILEVRSLLNDQSSLKIIHLLFI